MYQNIMVAVDNSECSNFAIDLAVDIAKSTGARLTGNHVYAARLHDTRFRQLEPGLPEHYRSEEILQHQRDIHDDLIGRGLRIISDSYLRVFQEKCQQAELTAEMKTPEGRNYEQLVKDGRESQYDLIVVGAHGIGRVQRSVLGSVCERLVRLAECDVLVARCAQKLGSGKLMVGIDGSEDSFAALGAALHLSRLYGNKVLAVAAYDPFFHSVAFRSIAGVLSDEAAKLFRFQEQEKLHDEIIDKGLANVYHSHLLEAQRIAEQEDIPLEIEVLEGKPFDVIAAQVEKIQPSLLLVGRIGIHHCEGVTLGSTAENLVRLAGCNVLVVGGRHLTQGGPHPNPLPEGEGTMRPPVSKMFKATVRKLPLIGQRPADSKDNVDAEKEIRWTAEAEQRLERVPSFARRMARKGIENFARENGFEEITIEVYEQARKRFGM